MLARDINDCTSTEGLMTLAQLYYGSFVVAMKRPQTTPPPSEHPSRDPLEDRNDWYSHALSAPPADHTPPSEHPSLEGRIDWYSHALSTPPADHRAQKQLALSRDNFRCVLSGTVDIPSWLGKRVTRAAEEPLEQTDAVHILPQGLFAGVAAVLSRFSNPSVPMDLSGPDMNKTWNLFTLTKGWHSLWDALLVWMEATATPNTYVVRTAYPGIGSHSPLQTVTFATVDPQNVPVPNPEFILLHAICAKVALLSGGGEYVDAAQRRLEAVDPVRAVGEEGGLTLLQAKLEMLHIIVPPA
ncbi:hypothetical protein DACRYDRAFT_110937 [Dacryopinax primogenitus]|uniref:HNH nuclease domain-containing protein n=1 Tax=Dacryopinax primogenitus (strain DJM 731) TaxID=1858805 RepID=M5FRV7_DACPD|nr:uncharacterized protein DACRYDRAFT_110937 [Dacryopinax primogenitus]EJT98493.1 hypothetical protein DACRYDRAFT_110937 [Dacryopinax primogenitus]